MQQSRTRTHKKNSLLLGGLAFAGVALASDPTPRSAPAGTSLKVAIDAKTGKLRPLTEEESAALDAQAAANGSNGVMARNARTATVAGTTSRARFPTTEAEALATARTVNGITAMKPMLESASAVTVVRNADGTLTFSENGEPVGAHTQEAASE